MSKTNNKLIDTYIDNSDWRVKENSNSNYSFAGLQGHIAGSDMTEWALDNMYVGEISKAHQDGIYHIHDISHPIVGYCCGWSLEDIIREGFNCGANFTYSTPAKHLDSLYGQLNNFIFTMSGEWAGAQALNSLDTYSAAFIRHDNMTENEVRRVVRQFVFNLNVKTRVAMQAPFTNVSIDLTVPEDLRYKPCIIGGIEMDFTYGDCQEEMNMFNKVLANIMMEGDGLNKIFTFPIITYSVTKDFPWDSELAECIFRFADEANSPYFSNFLNSSMQPTDVRSMCLVGDTKITIQSITGGRPKKVDIAEYVNNGYNTDEWLVRTSQGFLKVKNKIKLEVLNTKLITFNDGSTLEMTVDHPSLVYDNDNELNIVLAKNLQVGMKMSLLTRRGESLLGNSRSKDRILIHRGDDMMTINPLNLEKFEADGWIKGEPEWRRQQKSEIMSNPDINPMTGRTRTDEEKSKISESMKGHEVSDKCRKASSDRWKGLNNPVASQEYWNRKSIEVNNRQISPLEAIIIDYLESSNIQFEYQKVFNDNENDKTYVADFFVPEKNLIIESESKFNSTEVNPDWISSNPKLNFYKELGYDVMITNPAISSAWMSYLNKVITIVSIEDINERKFVYDIEIDHPEVHDFYANDILTHNCCRLRLDLRELMNSGGGLFGAGDKTGSNGVVTLNLSKISYISRMLSDPSENPQDYQKSIDLVGNYPELKARINIIVRGSNDRDKMKEELYFVMIQYFMDLARRSLLIKRDKVQESIDSNLIPFTKRYLGNIEHHFNTLGVNAGYEACLNLLGVGIDTPEGKALMTKTLDYMLNRLSDYQVMDNGRLLWNLEATPAEGASTRFAKIDKSQFNGIITGAGKNLEFYTNSTMLPEDYSDNIFEVLDHQDELQVKYTSGTVLHIYTQEPTHSWKSIQSLVKKIFSNYKLPYISISPDITVCPIHGRLDKHYDYCPYDHTEEEIAKLEKLGVQCVQK